MSALQDRPDTVTSEIGHLEISTGDHAGTTIVIDREDGTLGRRTENAYVIDDPAVSRVHARLVRSGTALVITDLGSTSGTMVNGDTATGPCALRDGDEVAFGPVTCVFHESENARSPIADTQGIEIPEVVMSPQLSPRQQEVLEGIADGLTNKEIAERLDITERTVKAYAQEVYSKLSVSNRAEAVARGAEKGLLPELG